MEIENPFPLQNEDVDSLQYNRNKAWRLGVIAGQSSLIKWLDDPCNEHCGYQVKDGIKTIHSIPHRKDCSRCWKELTGEKDE